MALICVKSFKSKIKPNRDINSFFSFSTECTRILSMNIILCMNIEMSHFALAAMFVDEYSRVKELTSLDRREDVKSIDETDTVVSSWPCVVKKNNTIVEIMDETVLLKCWIRSFSRNLVRIYYFWRLCYSVKYAATGNTIPADAIACKLNKG